MNKAICGKSCTFLYTKDRCKAVLYTQAWKKSFYLLTKIIVNIIYIIHFTYIDSHNTSCSFKWIGALDHPRSTMHRLPVMSANLTAISSRGKSWSEEARYICFQLHLSDQNKLGPSRLRVPLLLLAPHPSWRERLPASLRMSCFSSVAVSHLKSPRHTFPEAPAPYTRREKLHARILLGSWTSVSPNSISRICSRSTRNFVPSHSNLLRTTHPPWRHSFFHSLERRQSELFPQRHCERREVYLYTGLYRSLSQNFWSTGATG